MKNKERAMNLIMTIIMSVAMGVLAAFLVIRTNPESVTGTPVPVMYFSNIIMSVIVGAIVALVVPLGKLGRMLASKAGANPPGMKFMLINSIPMAVGNTLIVGLALSLFGVISGRSHMPAEVLSQMPPLPVMWLSSWLKLVVPTLILSYVLSVVLSPVVAKMVGLGGPGKGPEKGPGARPGEKPED